MFRAHAGYGQFLRLAPYRRDIFSRSRNWGCPKFRTPDHVGPAPGARPGFAPPESGSSEQFGDSDRIYHRAGPGWISLRSRTGRCIFDGRLAFPLGQSAHFFHSFRQSPAPLEFAGFPLPFLRNCLHSKPAGNSGGYIPRPFRRPVRWGHSLASDLRPRHSPHGSMGPGRAAFGAVCRRPRNVRFPGPLSARTQDRPSDVRRSDRIRLRYNDVRPVDLR